LLALSSTEVWAVVNTHEGFACVIGHLQDGEWTYWTLDDGNRIRDLAGSPDGTIWLAGDAGVFSFDGRGWTRRLDGPSGGVAVSQEGLVWVGGSLADHAPTPWLAGWDGERWTRLDSSPGSARSGFTPMALGFDGEVWITVYPGHSARDLMRYDGATLESVQIAGFPDPEGAESAVGVLAIEAAPNGDLWIGGYLSSDWDEVVLARFDGEAWLLYDWPTDHTAIPQLIFDLAAGPDGLLWMGGQTGLASFDGAEWTIHIGGVWVESLDVAPDGTVWYSDGQSLHTLPVP
jgi:streptogramin lyase